jgi:hypothetical protein
MREFRDWIRRDMQSVQNRMNAAGVRGVLSSNNKD